MSDGNLSADTTLTATLAGFEPRVGFARRVPLSYDRVGVVLAAADIVAVIGLGVLVSVGYHAFMDELAGDTAGYAAIGLWVSLMFVLGMQAQHLYRPASILRFNAQVTGALVTWTMAFCVLIALGFTLKVSDQFSRGTVFAFYAAGIVMLPLLRSAGSALLSTAIRRQWLTGRHNVVLFGDTEQLLASNIAADLRRYGYNVVNGFGVRPTPGRPAKTSRDLSMAVHDLMSFTRQQRVDEILLMFDIGQQRLIKEVSNELRNSPLPVRLVVARSLDNLLSRPMTDLGAAQAIELQKAPMSVGQRAAKRSLDLVLASAGLLALSPLFVLVALLIKLDGPGPVFFRQRRAGFNGREFRIYKFRSMRVMDDGAVVRQATKNDDRVTKIGRFLRKTSIDELPQLINVLAGEMSVVGPRPHALSHDSEYDKLIATYALRHNMKPGITGWAQVNGCRGETQTLDMMERRVSYDLWYIGNWSFWLDVKAVFLTVFQVLRAKDVY